MKLDQLPTPSLILDKNRLSSNIQMMGRKFQDGTVTLRPHLKTCKSADVAREIFAGGKGGITVSTLKEAEYFLEAGYQDILYAVSIAPQKLDQVKALQDRGATMTLLLDEAEVAAEVSRIGLSLGTVFPCLIEIDSDGKRAGLTPDDAALIDVARLLHAGEGTDLAGVMTHAGGSYACQSVDGIIQMAEQERLAITQAADRIREAGLPCPIVSLGSTPTATFGKSLQGVTEVRAGVYVFQDLVMTALGVCTHKDIAISVLATVISHKKDRNRLLIDAGSLALSADPGKPNPTGKPHFGQVCRMEDTAPLDGLWVNSCNQEHGLISLEGSSFTCDDFPVGTRLRILPNHACITAAAYSEYHVVEGGDDITAVWPRCNGW
ncbi:alanine racemase [Sneathiella chinensis]|nr:alanine racemase [Sneathiella chinensis]